LGRLIVVSDTHLSPRTPESALNWSIHQYRHLHQDATEHLWAPTTWAVLPETVQPTIGHKRAGILTVELTDAGDPEHTFAEPDGLQQTLTTDIQNPYVST
jgi:hypothetical protein